MFYHLVELHRRSVFDVLPPVWEVWHRSGVCAGDFTTKLYGYLFYRKGENLKVNLQINFLRNSFSISEGKLII